MTLRGKLQLAQVPLILALLVSGGAGAYFLTGLGRSAQEILRNNFRSVLAAQRMNESLERLDSAALFSLVGEQARAEELIRTHRQRFEAELEVQRRNVTEPTEPEQTQRLGELWERYARDYDAFQAESDAVQRRAAYFEHLLPDFTAAKAASEAILALNQDAIVRKSDRAKRIAEQSVLLLASLMAAGLLLALYASTSITRRLLRPVSVLAQATRRLGSGDLAVRAQVADGDEIGQLAADFNAMAERLQKYRASTLGELLTAQRISQATIDSLPDPVLVLSAEGRPLHANRAAQDWLHVSLEDGLDALDPALRALVDRVREHAVAGKGTYVPKGLEEAVRIATPEGERDLLPRATPLYAEEGDVVGTTLVLQDVSRLLRFEELRNNVVATVAHEFRTPLTSLRMAIHLLTEQRVGPLTEKQADLVYAAREDCDRLQSTVDELLDLSRIQAGRMELRLRPQDLEPLLADALEAQRALASECGVALRSEVLPGLGRALADADRIQVVLANLLVNAIRHSPPHGTVTLRAQETDGSFRVEVADEGPGIPREYQQAIFEKYFQVPGEPPGGAGLGLFIAKEIAHAHGGEIGVTSEPGRGSRFWFQLAKADPEGT